LNTLVQGKLLTQQEARQEIVAQGLLETDIEIEELPEELEPEEMPQEQPEFPFGRQVEEEGPVPAAQGGRGQQPEKGMTIRQELQKAKKLPHEWTSDELRKMMDKIVRPHMDAIARNAEAPRIRRLVKAATRAMLPTVSKMFEVITDDQILDFWLPEMTALDFDLPSEMESIVLRQDMKKIHDELESHLKDDPWWQTLSDAQKEDILRIFSLAYERGMSGIALETVRALYEEGLRSRPDLVGIKFNVVNKLVMRELEAKAADLVRHVNRGTKTFIKRIIMSGIRQGMAYPQGL